MSDLGSFRKAAQRLNTTQPNISARISSLESCLDVTLMERDAGSVRLTSRGEMLLEKARQVLQTTEQFIQSADQDLLFDGVLRLGVTEMIVHTWLRDYLRELKECFPRLTVELTVDMSAILEKELIERSIDLALQSGPFRQTTSGSIDLGIYPMIWIASPQLELHTKQMISFEDLVQFPVLTHARGTAPHREVANYFSRQRHTAAQLVPSSNLAACIHMVIDGYGCAAVPAAMVREELRNGELVELNYDWTPGSLEFSARYDHEKSPGFVAEVAQIARQVAMRFDQQTSEPVKIAEQKTRR